MDKTFNYDTAFSRNIGWVTETEQEILRSKRIAIAGLGGVGGSHLITLTRMGIGKFNISDMDIFELVNFNRQFGASLSHIGQTKVDVMAKLALNINPELVLNTFPQGVNQENLDDFLDGVDLYVDGLDFFALEARKKVFAACAEKDIPAITAAPIGMGAALLCFLPDKMTFEEYFRLNGHSEDEQLLRFLLGLSPAMLQMPYLIDDSRVDLARHKGPSTSMACELCAGLAASHALKVLLKRGQIPAAPKGLHFDAYLNKLSHTWRPAGNRNPIQKIGIFIARNSLSKKIKTMNTVAKEPIPETPIKKIIDLARWAPSGDNTQPWKFEILNERQFLIHAHDTRDWCVYDLDGHASQIAVGALLETIVIAASAEGLSASITRRKDAPETEPVIEVSLSKNAKLAPHPLFPYIKTRCTQRRSFSTRALTEFQKKKLEESVGRGYRIIWFEDKKTKWQVAKLLFQNAQIRLTIPEAYHVHKRIIKWNSQYSEDKIPDQAVGLDPVALKLMKWAMQSWERVVMMNKYFAGTWIPRIQLDLIPGMKCAAHCIIISEKKLDDIDQILAGGRAVQRFWLTAANMGLQFQPEMTPLIFSRYIKMSVNFTKESKAKNLARTLATGLDELMGSDKEHDRVFMGRIGESNTPKSRSIRKSQKNLMI